MFNAANLWIEGNPIEGEDDTEKSTNFEIKESNLFLLKLGHQLGRHAHPATSPTRNPAQIGIVNNKISIIKPPPADVGTPNMPKNPSDNAISPHLQPKLKDPETNLY